MSFSPSKLLATFTPIIFLDSLTLMTSDDDQHPPYNSHYQPSIFYSKKLHFTYRNNSPEEVWKVHKEYLFTTKIINQYTSKQYLYTDVSSCTRSSEAAFVTEPHASHHCSSPHVPTAPAPNGQCSNSPSLLYVLYTKPKSIHTEAQHKNEQIDSLPQHSYAPLT